VLALLNEVLDLHLEIWPDLGQQLGESVKDIVLTMIVPLALTLCLQRRPDLFQPASRAGPD
jgi:hypothetical protein